MENLRKVRKIQANQKLDSPTIENQDDTHPALEAKVPGNVLKSYREAAQFTEREPIYHAYQLMSHPVTTVPLNMDILAARRFFQKQGFNQMPVLSAQHRIAGMLSIKDLLQFIIIEDGKVRNLNDKIVADAMSKEVITAHPVSDIRRIAQVMQDYRLHCVPIVDDQDSLVGIVSHSDILRSVTNDPPLNLWT